ncbi:hypothetical protein EH227_24815 [Rouxiella chamberiensis]|nr:hypothetical protein EH227_24815 [Rouxiella chamberiensis]
MRKKLLAICVWLLIPVLSSCASTPRVIPSECPKPALPPAWMMQPPPDLLTPLNQIISPSETESQPQPIK